MEQRAPMVEPMDSSDTLIHEGKLERFELHPVRVPYHRPITWASVREDGADYLLLRVFTRDGVVGVSEGTVKPTWTGSTLRTLTAVIEDLLLPRLRDVNPYDLPAVNKALGKVPGHDLAKAMIDAACWDLVSQVKGVPLWKLWGGKRRVPVSASVTRQALKKMAGEAADMIERYGFPALKLKGGQGKEADYENIAAIRHAAGEGVTLYVDTNSAYRPDEVVEYASRLADLGVRMVEDPCRLEPGEAFRNLQEECPLPIIVDARCNDHLMTSLFLKEGARSFVLKMGKAGFSDNRAIAELARSRGAETHVGVLGGSSFGSLVALQMAAAIPDHEYALPAEATFFLQLAEEFVHDPLKIKGGCIELPDVPGFGQAIDWEKVKALSPE